MKKLFFAILAIILMPVQTLAVENGNVFSVKTDTAYIIPLNYRPINLKNTNTEVLRAEAVTNIDMTDSSVLIATQKEGIAYVSFKQKNNTVTLKFLVDNKAQEDTTLIKLDKADPPQPETKPAKTLQTTQTEQTK